MTTLAINKLWSFLQSLPLTANNERWLAERLLESAQAKTACATETASKDTKDKVWANYQLSPEITAISLKNRKMVSDVMNETLHDALEEKYK